MPTSTPTQAVQRIQFEPGGTGALIEGTLRVGETRLYVLGAFGGQIMRVYAEPEGADLRIFGEDGTLLKPVGQFDPFWRGALPITQDYFIEIAHSARAIGPWDRPLRLSVLINPPGQAIQWVDYLDEVNRFQLRYTDYFALADPPPELSTMKLQPALTLRFVGSEYFDRTNLADAYLAVGASSDAEVVANCTAPREPDREQPLAGIQINGVPFVRSSFGGVAAGNLYELVLHRASTGGACYEIAFFFHSSSVGAFPPEAGIVEFDRDGIQGLMENVLGTLRLNQP